MQSAMVRRTINGCGALSPLFIAMPRWDRTLPFATKGDSAGRGLGQAGSQDAQQRGSHQRECSNEGKKELPGSRGHEDTRFPKHSRHESGAGCAQDAAGCVCVTCVHASGDATMPASAKRFAISPRAHPPTDHSGTPLPICILGTVSSRGGFQVPSMSRHKNEDAGKRHPQS